MTPTLEPNGGDGYHKDFTLSITKALGDQLAVALDGLDRAPLNEASIAGLKEKPGVYQLYLNGEFVYVGKADKSLPTRLRNHLRKISGRRRISLEEMSFSCLYVAEDFSALAPEQLLISYHKELGGIPWNNNGFGNKDPGRNRDNTVLKANHFDMHFPIDLEHEVEGIPAGVMTLQKLLDVTKASLPYNFRYQKSHLFKERLVDIPNSAMSADSVFQLAAKEIPGSWQIVTLMGYVIMYDDNPRDYPSAWRYYRGAEFFDAAPEAAPPGTIEEINESDDEA
ncbi:GIY-YIG nuclease family protein [Streptomyces sp. NRRL S-237]|uniref:GIY-YIG nuclease family protein n=1 Tax=Streptomyces sp. NRRL S-237 TaxID=1463895 RepID=UPI0004C50A0B|nr:GIY-YIG nuclease family protein [Streptomyces sp. NRRL S-237]